MVAMNKATRAYVLQFGGAMLAYVVVLVASITVLQQTPHFAAPIRAVVAVTPTIPAVFGLLVFVRFLGSMDELQRRIQLDALGFAFGATAILTFAYGLLENAGVPQLRAIWLAPLMVMLWGCGAAVASRRYR